MNLTSPPLYLLAVSGLVFAPALSADSSDVVDELKQCARISQQESRIECYESLGRRVLEIEASGQALPAETATQATSATAVVAGAAVVEPSGKAQMDDEMGGYKFEDKPSDHPDNAIFARLTLCQQDRDKTWYFKFENGQVWKQVDRTTLNFQGCDFPVTILKDGFGYKMQIEGSERQIRISRRK